MSTPDISTIQKCVADYCGVSVQSMLGHSRKRAESRPRMLAMYLCRKLTPLSTGMVGRAFKGRDHTTVLHAEAAISELLKAHPQLQEAIAEITSRVMDGPSIPAESLKALLSLPIRPSKKEAMNGA
jgi:chromosomal replication initiator protein